MTINLRSESRSERELSHQLREAALATINERAIDETELAALLGVPRTGVYWLSLKKNWPIDLSVRVAEALDLHIELKIDPNGTNGVTAEARPA
jgi:hypothetical protein